MNITGTCPKCGKECEIEITDMSFGWERGSERGTHHEMESITNCCGVDIDASEQIREAQLDAALSAYDANMERMAEEFEGP